MMDMSTNTRSAARRYLNVYSELQGDTIMWYCDSVVEFTDGTEHRNKIDGPSFARGDAERSARVSNRYAVAPREIVVTA